MKEFESRYMYLERDRPIAVNRDVLGNCENGVGPFSIGAEAEF